MVVAFAQRSLRDSCQSEAAAVRKFGTFVADAVLARLGDIRAAERISDLIALGLTVEEPPLGERVSLALVGDWTIKLTPNHTPVPTLRSGLPDWSRVSRVKVIEVGGHSA